MNRYKPLSWHSSSGPEINIPEDLRDMVDEIVDRAIDNNLDVSTEQLMVKAILAENERCAKIAEEFAVHWGLAYKTMTDQMAEAIRRK